MGNGKHKDFLNAGILGGGAGVANKRAFRSVSTEYIESPDYNARFFETFPTVWASAYAFMKALAAESKAENGDEAHALVDDEATLAVTEEWASLFLLHYFGIVHLVTYKQEDLEKDYDKDLWLALSGTFPNIKTNSISAVRLLETNEHTVVGAYYPEIIFFPGRGRASWSGDKVLSTYLVGTRLSWELCSRNLLTSDLKLKEFQEHLMRVSLLLPSQTFKNRLLKFCERSFRETVQQVQGSLQADPALWEIPGNKPPEGREFLERYPLRKPNKKGGYTYYLVYNMPQTTPWMNAPIMAGCSAYQYRQTGEHQITVHAGGKDISCELDDEKDEIVALKSLFLPDPPYWCKVNRTAEAYTSKIRTLHKVELRDPVLKQEEVAICLAPVKRAFLTHFPETFGSLRGKGVSASPDVQRPSVDWTFPVLGKEVRWHTTPIGQREMPKTSLALWPPKVSPKWSLYAIYGTGSKEACGRWHLVDEEGGQGRNVELEEEEYISILQASGVPNRPRALLFTDNSDNERGVLFLNDFDEQSIDTDERSKVTLSVDFGTSNTCIAYKRGDGQSAILKYQLSPQMIWGERSILERPGFVPFKWGGKKGYFPTILLSRRTDSHLDEVKPDELQLEHLFKVDIPGLHAEMEERLFTGQLNTGWEPHSNMKWDLDIQMPWRSLFLSLGLLYAHAEVFFSGTQGSKINRYIFTFPLAFTETDRREFHAEAQKAIQRVRQYCYGVEPISDKFIYSDSVDESTAIAKSARVGAATNTMEVFVDVGGGTADIAVRNGNDFLVLDSIKVAGNTFFRFSKKNFDHDLEGATKFKRHLARVLLGRTDGEMEKSHLEYFDLGTFYSLAINGLNDEDFRKREGKVIQDGMSDEQTGASYQRYRAKLFFRHILAYALLQAAAAVVDNKIMLEEDGGIKLILGGNAWGLMLFAELPRKRSKLEEEARQILHALKEKLSETATEEEQKYLDTLSVFGVELLNETNLSKAKTDVAIGALNAVEDRKGGRSDKENALPYTGITIKDLQINDRDPTTVRWRERWGFEEFKRKLGFMDQIKSARFEQPRGLKQPLDPVLSVFTRLGNTARNDQDNMPGETWRDINAEVCEEIANLQGNRLDRSPINHFISRVLYPEDEQRDFLDTLAEENGNFKNDRS